MDDPASANGWHLSKRIDPLQLVGTVLVVGGFVWFFAMQDGRLTTIESVVVSLDKRVTATESVDRIREGQMGRQTALLESIDARLGRLEARDDALNGRRR